MRIRTQLLQATVAGAGAMVLAVAGSLLYVTQRNAQALHAERDRQQIARDVASLLNLAQEYSLFGEARPARQWYAHHAQLVKTVAAAMQREPAPNPALVALREQALDLAPLFGKLEIAVRDGRAGAPSDLAARRREFIVDRLVAETEQLVEARHRWASAVGEEQARYERLFTLSVLAAPGLLLLLIVGLALLVSRRVLVPLAQLQAATTAIQRGDLSLRCDVAARNELGDAARAVNAMADSLLAANRSLLQEVQQRRAAEARLRGVMESSPLGMFVGDAQGQCLYANPAWQRIAGLSGPHSLGAGWRRALHPEDHDRVLGEWHAAAADGRPQVGEHRYCRPDGTLVWVRIHFAPMPLDGEGAGLVCTVEDITERHQLDQALAARSAELARSNEELERFAYVASHDLQEPLRMVTSYGQLLVRRHKAQLSGEAQEFVDFIVDGGQRAQALIGDLLSLARVSSQARPMRPVALEAVLADALHQLRARVQDTRAVITHDALPVVAADARQMGQLLHNLLGNALKFHGPATPLIHVSASRAAGGWRIGVADNGIGIEPQFFERIFVLFQRLHLRTDYAGTGIGLAICKKVVERHGGTIGVRCEPGHGAEFFFTLPDAPAHLLAQVAATA